MTEEGQSGMVTYHAGTLSRVNGVSSHYLDYANCTSWWYPTPSHTYISYPVYPPNKHEQAFRVVSKLLELEMLDSLTVKKFIDLVGKIAEVL